ncbi:hypothetical protein ACLB2K_055720 [Fragaria x ananassa]
MMMTKVILSPMVNNIYYSFVIIDHFGYPIIAGAKVLGSLISVVTCYALKDGLLKASHLNFRCIDVEGDSKLVIGCINKLCDPLKLKIPYQRHPEVFPIRAHFLPQGMNFVVGGVTPIGFLLVCSVDLEKSLPLSF